MTLADALMTLDRSSAMVGWRDAAEETLPFLALSADESEQALLSQSLYLLRQIPDWREILAAQAAEASAPNPDLAPALGE